MKGSQRARWLPWCAVAVAVVPCRCCCRGAPLTLATARPEGVLVLDRINGVAYVNLSERAHEDLARRWVEELGYNELVTFRSADKRGK